MFKLFLMLILVPLTAMAASEEALEESGENGLVDAPPAVRSPASRASVLLIPDSTADAVGMYDPNDGTYLGNFIVDDPSGTAYDLQTPLNAVEYIDIIFLSDQASDAVYAFDDEGNYLYTAVSSINNCRGIDFRNDTLFVTSGDDFIAMYSGPDVFAGNFVNDGSDPFDILFIDEVTSGSALVSDIQGSTDNVRHYDADGTLIGEVFSVLFPEQVQLDLGNPGYYFAAGFSTDSIYRFQVDGTISDKWYLDGPRGVFRLGNGNILATNGTGVHEIDPSTGSMIETEYSGQCRFIELVDVTVGVADDMTAPAGLCTVSMSPNPFADLLSIAVNLAEPSPVAVEVFALDGRVAAALEPGVLSQGAHTLQLSGEGLENGIYLVRVTTDLGTEVEKVQLLR